MGIIMNEYANPLDYLLECCESATLTGQWKLSRFTVSNAKDELVKLRQLNKELALETAKANQFAVDEMNHNINYKVVGWVKINDRGDLYDPRLCYNPYEQLIPLYCNDPRVKDVTGKE